MKLHLPLNLRSIIAVITTITTISSSFLPLAAEQINLPDSTVWQEGNAPSYSDINGDFYNVNGAWDIISGSYTVELSPPGLANTQAITMTYGCSLSNNGTVNIKGFSCGINGINPFVPGEKPSDPILGSNPRPGSDITNQTSGILTVQYIGDSGCTGIKNGTVVNRGLIDITADSAKGTGVFGFDDATLVNSGIVDISVASSYTGSQHSQCIGIRSSNITNEEGGMLTIQSRNSAYSGTPYGFVESSLINRGIVEVTATIERLSVLEAYAFSDTDITNETGGILLIHDGSVRGGTVINAGTLNLNNTSSAKGIVGSTLYMLDGSTFGVSTTASPALKQTYALSGNTVYLGGEMSENKVVTGLASGSTITTTSDLSFAGGTMNLVDNVTLIMGGDLWIADGTSQSWDGHSLTIDNGETSRLVAMGNNFGAYWTHAYEITSQETGGYTLSRLGGNGNLVVTYGTLALNVDGDAGSGDSLEIRNASATVELVGGSEVNFGYNLKGAGSLLITTGPAVLDGDNSDFAGTIIVKNGTAAASQLKFANDAATGGTHTVLSLEGGRFYHAKANGSIKAGTVKVSGMNWMYGSSSRNYSFDGDFCGDGIFSYLPTSTLTMHGSFAEFSGTLRNENTKSAGTIVFAGRNGLYEPTLAGNNIFGEGTVLTSKGAADYSETASPEFVFAFNNDSLNMNALVTNMANVTQDGTGVLILTQQNTSAGILTVNNGVIQIGSSATTAAWHGDYVVNAGTLRFTNVADGLVTGSLVTGDGAEIILDSGVLFSGATLNMTGNTTLRMGCDLKMGTDLTTTWNGNSLTIDNGGTRHSFSMGSEFAGSWSGSFTLRENESGEGLTLTQQKVDKYVSLNLGKVTVGGGVLQATETLELGNADTTMEITSDTDSIVLHGEHGGHVLNAVISAEGVMVSAGEGTQLTLDSSILTLGGGMNVLKNVIIQGSSHIGSVLGSDLSLDLVTFVLSELNSSLGAQAVLAADDDVALFMTPYTSGGTAMLGTNILENVSVSGDMTLDLSYWADTISEGGYDSLAFTLGDGVDIADGTQISATLDGVNYAMASYAADNMVQFNVASLTGAIPEPTTATLSLLALTMLAARRRRKSVI